MQSGSYSNVRRWPHVLVLSNVHQPSYNLLSSLWVSLYFTQPRFLGLNMCVAQEQVSRTFYQQVAARWCLGTGTQYGFTSSSTLQNVARSIMIHIEIDFHRNLLAITARCRCHSKNRFSKPLSSSRGLSRLSGLGRACTHSPASCTSLSTIPLSSCKPL